MRKAAILVGGRGERLGALTDAIPKPMADIKKRPFLEYQLALLKKYQISEIVLCVGYLKDAILGYFGDGSRFGLRIEYSIENDFLGTGGALKQAAGLLSDEFLMLYGDSFLPIDYTALCAEWEKSSTEAMVVCYDNHECIAENNIYLDPQGLVQSYNKRTPDKRANSVEAGVSVLKKEV
ncbi:MAG: NTP transferase domain-containing protein, partial [Candidatus Omnitrophica bacterium]|nr:NTP transferase domain-containing protein [Candidatus Omnitrophota bacterium]